mgnify:CR=1 FL=1
MSGVALQVGGYKAISATGNVSPIATKLSYWVFSCLLLQALQQSQYMIQLQRLLLTL